MSDAKFKMEHNHVFGYCYVGPTMTRSYLLLYKVTASLQDTLKVGSHGVQVPSPTHVSKSQHEHKH